MFAKLLNVGGLVQGTKIGSLLAAAVVAGLPAVAAARPHGGIHIDVAVPVTIDQGPACPPPPCPPQQVARQVWVEPVYRTVCDRQWVEATTRTVCDRVWVPPVTQAAAPQAVWVPDQYAWRDGMTYDGYGRPRRCQVQVLVVPGHYETCGGGTVVVTPGHYADVPRTEVVCPAHWQDVQRQEVVVPGHWETRVETVYAPPPPERPHLDVRVRLPF